MAVYRRRLPSSWRSRQRMATLPNAGGDFGSPCDCSIGLVGLPSGGVFLFVLMLAPSQKNKIKNERRWTEGVVTSGLRWRPSEGAGGSTHHQTPILAREVLDLVGKTRSFCSIVVAT